MDIQLRGDNASKRQASRKQIKTSTGNQNAIHSIKRAAKKNFSSV
jgi:hypothetical protein